MVKLPSPMAALCLIAAAHSLVSATIWPYYTFQTQSFNPPVLAMTKSGAALDNSLLIFGQTITKLLTPGDAEPPANTMIYNNNGNLIWNGPLTTSANLQVQQYMGQTVLTYWSGTIATTDGYYGQINILDQTYTQIATICPDIHIVTASGTPQPCYVDLHEAYFTSYNTVVFTATNVTQADLTSVDGPANGWIYDCLFFELDLASNQIVYQFSAYENGIPINTTKAPFPSGSEGTSQSNPYAWFHINSVQPLGDGTYFMNSRFTWSSYKVLADGTVGWVIDGKTGGDFTIPAGFHIEWQHHARIEPSTSTATSLHVHWFNNYNSIFVNGTPTVGPDVTLDLGAKTVTVNHIYSDPADTIYTTAQGSHDILANGNHLMGYGTTAKAKEYGAAGDVRMTVRWGYDNQVACYRVHKSAWVGRPAANPSVAAHVATGKAYMSWNGATEVAFWKVYAGLTTATLKPVVYVAKSDFETNASIPNIASLSTGFVKAGAYDANNNFLRNSSAVAIA